ncbi:MAG: Flp pilus assembly complex ATPase component TadA, partial [Leucobacter sp.]|nr:Flp pilus assembly complex ATPase component TadA [Leucobacter sp.]
MRRVLDRLVQAGVLSREALDEVIAAVGERRADRELVRRKLVTEAQIGQALSAVTGVPFVDLMSIEIDPDAVALLSSELARKHMVLPIAATPSQLVLAMLDPGNVIALDDVTSMTGLAVKPVVATMDSMQLALNRHVRLDEQIAGLSHEIGENAQAIEETDTVENLEGGADDTPIVRFVNLIISQAIQDRASDIHIDQTESHLRVRYRIDGVLHDTQEAPPALRDGVISRLKIMSGIDIAEKRKPQDGRISVRHSGRKVDLRVATLPTVWGEKIVMRILDNTAAQVTLGDLNMSERNLDVFSRSFRKPHGMLLVTGPTGSGKSTTLYTTLNEIARPEINVITIEDPVEFRMAGISQMQVNPRAGLTFASALRSILRGDPDVVLVGEIRDGET